MPHRIYGPVEHQLSAVTFSFWLPTRATSYEAHVVATGSSSTKRGSLWVVNEAFPHVVGGNDLSCVDAIHHIAVAALQDRPQTQRQIEHSLQGGKTYEDLPLPF